MSEDLLGSAVKVASGGGGFAAVLLAGRWLLDWLAGRHDRRESRLDAKDDAIDERWAAYTRRMEQRCEKLELRVDAQQADIDKCHEEKRALEHRVSMLEGYSTGLGDLRQEAQRVRALEHQVVKIREGVAAADATATDAQAGKDGVE